MEMIISRAAVRTKRGKEHVSELCLTASYVHQPMRDTSPSDSYWLLEVASKVRATNQHSSSAGVSHIPPPQHTPYPTTSL